MAGPGYARLCPAVDMCTKRLRRGQKRYGVDADLGVLHGCTLAPPGEYA